MQIMSLSCYYGPKNIRASKVSRFILYKANKVFGPKPVFLANQAGGDWVNTYRMETSSMPMQNKVRRSFSNNDYYGNGSIANTDPFPSPSRADSGKIAKHRNIGRSKMKDPTSESSFLNGNGATYMNGQLCSALHKNYVISNNEDASALFSRGPYNTKVPGLANESDRKGEAIRRSLSNNSVELPPYQDFNERQTSSRIMGELQPFIHNAQGAWVNDNLYINEAFIIDEWKFLAETLNRFNAFIFIILLTVIASIYLYFRSP